MMFNGRVMHTTAHCLTCDTRTAFTGTVRVNSTGSEYSHGIRVKPDGSGRVLGMCTCGTPLAHPVLGAHLELRPVCGSCKPQPGNPVAYPQPEPDAYTLRLHTAPGNAMYASDLSEAVRAVALLLADNATAGTMPAEPERSSSSTGGNRGCLGALKRPSSRATGRGSTKQPSSAQTSDPSGAGGKTEPSPAVQRP